MQAFCGVNSHHTDSIARTTSITYDFAIALVEPVEETLQRRYAFTFELQGSVQKFVERIGGFVAQTTEQVLAGTYFA